MKVYKYTKYISLFIVSILPFLGVAAPAKTDFTVVIDAGHGGKDTGALDNGIREKDVNLGTALKLGKLIEKNHKNIKVVYTRDKDEFISLQERANIANRNRADLFISIHTNSVALENPNRKTIEGASTYTLGLHKDKDNQSVARRENSVMTLEDDYNTKYSGFDPESDESYIIFEMAQKANLAQSVKFAEAVQKQLSSVASRRDRGVKQAGFWVLWATSMPSVLIELDFITNPDVASFIGSEEGQQKMAQGISNAVDSYFASLSPTRSSSAKQSDAKKSSAKENRDKNTKGKNADPKSKESSSKKEEIRNQSASENESGKTDVTLAAFDGKNDSQKRQVSSASKSTQSSFATPRRRRNSKAREKSENRSYELAVVSDERVYVVEDEPIVEEVKESAPGDNDKPSNDKKKKSKKKDKKKQNTRTAKVGGKDVTVTMQPKSDKSDEEEIAVNSESRGNEPMSGKDFVKAAGGDAEPSEAVASSPKKTTQSTEKPGQKTVSSNSKNKKKETSGLARLDKRVTTYRIQVLASKDKLKQNSPRFCGLKPIECTKKGGMYKYTYGETTDEAEIRKMLVKVRKLIPDAFIVTTQN